MPAVPWAGYTQAGHSPCLLAAISIRDGLILSYPEQMPFLAPASSRLGMRSMNSEVGVGPFSPFSLVKPFRKGTNVTERFRSRGPWRREMRSGHQAFLPAAPARCSSHRAAASLSSGAGTPRTHGRRQLVCLLMCCHWSAASGSAQKVPAQPQPWEINLGS